jgi:hypothetical protein
VLSLWFLYVGKKKKSSEEVRAGGGWARERREEEREREAQGRRKGFSFYLANPLTFILKIVLNLRQR